MNIEATKSINKIMVSEDVMKEIMKPYQADKLLLMADEELKGFDALVREINELLENNNFIDIENKNVRYYKELDLIIDLETPSKIDITKEYDNKINSRKEKFEGFDSEYLTIDEANKIYFEYSNAPAYKAILCKSDKKEDLEEICFTDGKKKYKIPYNDEEKESLYSSLSSIRAFIALSNAAQELNKIATSSDSKNKSIKKARDILAYHFKENEDFSCMEIFIKYNLIPRNLQNRQLFAKLFELYHQDYVMFNNKGEIVLTPEAKKAIKEGKLKKILNLSLNINKVKVDKIQKADIDNPDEKNKLLKYYLNCDKERAQLDSYDLKRMEDPNLGHWELWNIPNKNTITLKDGQSLIARNPLADIKEDSVVGIDFGTKSTIVVYQDETDTIQPMRIGRGAISREVQKSDFENPTVMQFIDIQQFLKSYHASNGRPYTKWNDLTISHTANESLKDVNVRSDEFYSFFYDLKQWAGDSGKKIIIRDKHGQDRLLKPYIELNEDDFDPIEIYAYYIGLYINNMNNGIFLDYLLSFPVTYEKEVRARILKSFERGLKKSLPNEVLENKEAMDRFRVEQGASEPAAYAICALEQYGFDPELGEKVFYGIFDFGGGTTDFDFGLWTSSEDSDIYDYTIRHFGSEGDRYLGGENLLELLAYQVFTDNINVCRKNNLAFQKPADDSPVSEVVRFFVNDSQEAKMNTKLMIETLRDFWERSDENYMDKYKNGVKIGLFDRNGTPKMNLLFEIDTEKLDKILENRIDKGIRQFFNALKHTFASKYIAQTGDVEEINIFLAGNSSKSSILAKVFEKYMQETNRKIRKNGKGNTVFKIFPPLGTEEARKIQEENGVSVPQEITAPNGKTGVAFGLIEGKKGGRIEIIEEKQSDSEAKFAYYLGINKKKKFYLKINRDTPYGQWTKFISAAREEFEIYYTSLPEATTNQLSVSDEGVKRKRCHIEQADENAFIFIRFIKPAVIEYAAGISEEAIDEKQAVTISFE